MAHPLLTILTGRNLPKIRQPQEPAPSIINEKTIADFTRVVEEMGILRQLPLLVRMTPALVHEAPGASAGRLFGWRSAQKTNPDAGRRQHWMLLRNESRPRLIVSAEAEMSEHQREIYHSENGDRWLLCRDENGRAFVLHKANVSSGGTATEIELGNFLGRGKSGPEHQALARLIGSLVDSD